MALGASIRKFSRWSVLAVVVLTGANAYAEGANLEQARSFMRNGKAADAYVILEKSAFDQAGDIEFDTLLGIAALDSGKPDKATLAFERVLALNPNATGVRLDMARAYFALGDFPRARQELTIVAQQNPPPAAVLVINKMIAVIDQKEQAKRTVVNRYLESSVGHDDNITSVVADFTNAVLATYNLAGFQPIDNAVKRDSAIFGVAGGADATHQLSGGFAIFSGADMRHRHVFSANNYSSEQLDLRGGISYTAGANVLRGSLVAQGYRQRTDVPTANRNAFGLNAEWRRVFSERDQLSVFTFATRQRFHDIEVNDVNSLTIGASWLHLFDSARKPLLYASLLTGRDHAQSLLANGADNSKRSVSGRVYGQFSLNENIDLFGSFGLLYRADRSMNARATLVDYGNDHTTDAMLGLNWRPAKDWTVRPQFTYVNNNSNVALSEYKRSEATVTVRYDFH